MSADRRSGHEAVASATEQSILPMPAAQVISGNGWQVMGSLLCCDRLAIS